MTISASENVTYSGSAQEPCTAAATGAGGLNQALNVSYSNNLNAGTATANASFAGDANHTGSSDTKSFTIDKADPIITAAGGTFTYDGNPHGGSATAVGVKGEPLTPLNVAYKDSLGALLAAAPANAGSYSLAARYLGDVNYNQKQSAAAALMIEKAASVTTGALAEPDLRVHDYVERPVDDSVPVRIALGGKRKLLPQPDGGSGRFPPLPAGHRVTI